MIATPEQQRIIDYLKEYNDTLPEGTPPEERERLIKEALKKLTEQDLSQLSQMAAKELDDVNDLLTSAAGDVGTVAGEVHPDDQAAMDKARDLLNSQP